MNTTRLSIIFSVAAVLLCVPLIAMQFSEGVVWTAFDFIVAGILLFGTGLLLELVLSKFTKTKHRIMLCLALFSILFLVWAELAVGIFGSPIAGS